MSFDKDDQLERDGAYDPDLLYWAWTIIANAHEGDWSKATDEWRTAAVRWRDQFHATLSASEGEHCQACGRTYPDFVYWLPNEVWEQITPKPTQREAGLLCPTCAATRARKQGITLYWTATAAGV